MHLTMADEGPQGPRVSGERKNLAYKFGGDRSVSGLWGDLPHLIAAAAGGDQRATEDNEVAFVLDAHIQPSFSLHGHEQAAARTAVFNSLALDNFDLGVGHRLLLRGEPGRAG